MPTDLPQKRRPPLEPGSWTELLLATTTGVFLAFLMMAALAVSSGGGR